MPETGGWFFDCVTLSNFAFSDGLPLIRKRYRGRGYVTTEVVDELSRGVAAGYAPLAGVLTLVDSGVLCVVALSRSERATFRPMLAHLGAGEASSIAVARQRKGVVVTDDLAARRTCVELAVPVTGTIGILRAAVRDGDLAPAQANAWLDRMIAAGFHSPVPRIG